MKETKMADRHAAYLEKVLCSVYRTAKSDCIRCSSACPVDAVRIAPEGPKIANRCTGCGACVAACPNGALAVAGLEEDKLTRLVGEKTVARADQPFIISCRQGDPAADFVLPCLSRLTEGMLLASLKSGIATVTLLRPPCSKCSWHKTVPLLDGVIERVRQLSEMIGRSADWLQIAPVPLHAVSGIPEKTLSRRRFLGAMGTKAVETAAEALPTVLGKDRSGIPEEVFRKTLVIRGKNKKRISLLKALEGATASRVVVEPSAVSLLGEIAVDANCTGCGACATLCPAGAIVLKENELDFSLLFKSQQCTNCGVCYQSCVYGAVKCKSEVRLNRLLEKTESLLFSAVKKTCRVCGMRFVGQLPDVCGLCTEQVHKQKRLVELMTIVEL